MAVARTLGGFKSMFLGGGRKAGGLYSRVLAAAQWAPKRNQSIIVSVNKREIEVPKGATLLDACRAAGVNVPTLCHHPKTGQAGVCRLCLVEVNGNKNKLLPACAHEAEDGMVILTNTDEVHESVVDQLNLLLSRHPNACMTCGVSGDCEFQDLLYRYRVLDKDSMPKTQRPSGKGFDLEKANCMDLEKLARDAVPSRDAFDLGVGRPPIEHDMAKCLMCMRCVTACSDVQGMGVLGVTGRGSDAHVDTAGGLPMGMAGCISCGACVHVCPVGATVELDAVHPVMDELLKKKKKMIVQVAPAVRVALGEPLGAGVGGVSAGQLAAGLRKLGFDEVYDTQFTADLTIMEEGTELIKRVTEGGVLPMFTSCCPGWINWVEKHGSDFIPNLSSCRSPQGMLGSLVKDRKKQEGIAPEDVCVVSIMPCVAKKDEAIRPALTIDGVPETDFVLTTRELARMFQIEGIAPGALKEEEFDDPLGKSTGAATIFGVTGGVMEAALRTAYEVVTGDPLDEVHMVRGLDGIRRGTVDLAGTQLNVAIAHTGSEIHKLMNNIREGKEDLHFVELMMCEGGCIGGAGNPKSLDPAILQERSDHVYDLDEKSVLRKSHHNPSVQKLYEDYLGEPNSELAHKLLHTHYSDRSKQQVPSDADF